MNTINDAVQQLQSTRKILMDSLVHVDVLLAMLAPDATNATPPNAGSLVAKTPAAAESQVTEPPPTDAPLPTRTGDLNA